jgi:hypothetical protein
MATQTWMDTVEELSNEALTVEAQTAPLPQKETFLGQAMMPPQDVDSVKVDDVTVRAIRATTGRREWNTPGFLIEKAVPDEFKMTILPIEGRDHINELEYQLLNEKRVGANRQKLQDLLRVTIPARVRDLAVANRRTVEQDIYNAAFDGVVRQANPNNLQEEVVVQFPWRGERIQQALTPWNDVSVNAYNELIAFVKEGLEELGAIDGLMLRGPLFEAIRADGPTVGAGNKKMNLKELEAEITGEIGQDFKFIINRAWIEPRGVKTFLLPIQKAVLIPAGGQFGRVLRAPVVRSIDANEAIGAGANGEPIVDVRGQGAYRESQQNGKLTTIEVQLNAVPRPDQKLIWVQNTGVNG